MMGITQLREKMSELKNPRESEAIRDWARILAEQERESRKAALAILDAMDADHDLDPPRDVEDRIDDLCGLLGAYVKHRGDVRGYYLEQYGPDVGNIERAKSFIGLSAEEWEHRQATWAELWRNEGLPDGRDPSEMDDRDLAKFHVEQSTVLGCSFEAFERDVVNLGPGEAMQAILAGEFEETNAALRRAADAVEERGSE